MLAVAAATFSSSAALVNFLPGIHLAASSLHLRIPSHLLSKTLVSWESKKFEFSSLQQSTHPTSPTTLMRLLLLWLGLLTATVAADTLSVSASSQSPTEYSQVRHYVLASSVGFLLDLLAQICLLTS
jgi:hypothetical protein